MWGERAHRAIEEVDAMKMRQAQQADELRKLKEELAAERDRRAAGTAAPSPDDHSCLQTASASLAPSRAELTQPTRGRSIAREAPGCYPRRAYHWRTWVDASR